MLHLLCAGIGVAQRLTAGHDCSHHLAMIRATVPDMNCPDPPRFVLDENFTRWLGELLPRLDYEVQQLERVEVPGDSPESTNEYARAHEYG